MSCVYHVKTPYRTFTCHFVCTVFYTRPFYIMTVIMIVDYDHDLSVIDIVIIDQLIVIISIVGQ